MTVVEWKELTDQERQQVFDSLPDKMEGFLKTWGLIHFAKGIEEKCREKNSGQLEDVEQYRMQMVAISVAALGFWKKGDLIHPDYHTSAIEDVASLYQKYDKLFQKDIGQATPGGWFTVGILGHPMREYSPGKWEAAEWPSENGLRGEEDQVDSSLVPQLPAEVVKEPAVLIAEEAEVPALLPCPFCGDGNPGHCKLGGEKEDDQEVIRYVICNTCGATCWDLDTLPEKNAYDAWNTRYGSLPEDISQTVQPPSINTKELK